MRKLLLLLTVCVTLTSCTSAGTQSESDTGTSSENSSSSVVSESVSETSSPDELKSELLQLTNCYKKENFALPDNMAGISTSFRLSDRSIIAYLDKEDFNGTELYKTDAYFSKFELFEYEKPEEMQNYDVAHDQIFFNSDGTACSIVTFKDHGGVVAPEEWDENFDYESYNANCITTYMICTYDKDGKILTKSAFEYPEEVYDDYGYVISGVSVADGDSILIPFEDGSIRRLSSDGTFTTLYTLENPEDYAYITSAHLYRDRDGKIIAMMNETTETYDTNGNPTNETVRNFMEFDGEKMGDVLYSCKEYEVNGSIIFGRGDYRFFVPTIDGVIGVKDDNTTETVIDWLSSSLNAMSTILPCGENDFIGMDWNDNSEAVLKLVPRDMSDFADVEFITVSNCDTAIINDFNNSNDKYRVQLVEYSYEDNNQQLNMDIISGNAPDVICGLDYSTYLNYRSKDVFTDLYELMDDGLNKEMIMPNVVTALESDGKLYSLCTSFNINTLVAKTKFCNKENWTFDDMLNLYDNAPESATHLYDGETKLDVFRRMFYTMNDLIDYENFTCNFNSDEFIQLLEFCNRFVDTVDKPSKTDEYDAFSEYMTEKYHWFGNDCTLVEPLQFYDPSTYNLVKYTQGNGEDLTLVGYPSNNGKGGRITPDTLMSITEKCENKQGAWEFLKFYVLESNEVPEPENEYSNIYNIPSLTDSFEKAMKNEMVTKHSASGESYPSYTQEDVDMLTEYIKSCDTIGTVLDNDIVAVCEEEAGLYFAGEQKADKSAENIQNRVSILISERS